MNHAEIIKQLKRVPSTTTAVANKLSNSVLCENTIAFKALSQAKDNNNNLFYEGCEAQSRLPSSLSI